MNNATVWSKDNCGYCTAAIGLLRSKGFSVEVKKVGGGVTKEDLLQAVPGARTLPQIFLNNTYVGDYTALLKVFDEDYS